jgi:hypothetical protein
VEPAQKELEIERGDAAGSAAQTSASGQPANGQAKRRDQRKYRSPLPHGVPLPLPEHESLHTYVQRARNISMFSIAFTLVAAVVGLIFAWSTNRCGPWHPWQLVAESLLHLPGGRLHADVLACRLPPVHTPQ